MLPRQNVAKKYLTTIDVAKKRHCKAKERESPTYEHPYSKNMATFAQFTFTTLLLIWLGQSMFTVTSCMPKGSRNFFRTELSSTVDSPLLTVPAYLAKWSATGQQHAVRPPLYVMVKAGDPTAVLTVSRLLAS
jgi:hypothetical protein